MKKIMINGYPYLWDGITLFLEEVDKVVEVDKKFLTESEREQLHTGIFYDGKPMISF